MIDAATKLYVQLAPDAEGLAELIRVQKLLELNKQNRPVAADKLHMTVLHIGEVERLIHAINDDHSVSSEAIMPKLEKLVTNLQQAIQEADIKSLSLLAQDYEYFGRNQNTFVLRFDADSQLQRLHNETYKILKQFFTDCGIADAEKFMRGHSAFEYAHTLQPHVALAKSYSGDKPVYVPKRMRFTIMPVVY